MWQAGQRWFTLRRASVLGSPHLPHHPLLWFVSSFVPSSSSGCQTFFLSFFVLMHSFSVNMVLSAVINNAVSQNKLYLVVLYYVNWKTRLDYDDQILLYCLGNYTVAGLKKLNKNKSKPGPVK